MADGPLNAANIICCIAEEFPAVCDQELLLIRRTVPDCLVERVHWRLEGGHACGFRITPLAQD